MPSEKASALLLEAKAGEVRAKESVFLDLAAEGVQAHDSAAEVVQKISFRLRKAEVL